jgi:probable HAF family extracellular repeat protein
MAPINVMVMRTDVYGVNDALVPIRSGLVTSWWIGQNFPIYKAANPCSNTEYINERGQLIGTSTDCHGTILHIFLWENGSMVDLSSQVPPESGFVLLEPVVINEVGEIVVNGITVITTL